MVLLSVVFIVEVGLPQVSDVLIARSNRSRAMRKPVVMSLLTVRRTPAPTSAYLPTRIANPSCCRLFY